MQISERIDAYLTEASAQDLKKRVKTALDNIHFPYKDIEATKSEVTVTSTETDSVTDKWNQLQKTLDALSDKLAKHNIIPDDVVIFMQPSNK